jgi:hypothetical protein
MGDRSTDLKALVDIPPWEWPEGVGRLLLGILGDHRADESDRLLAAELAGDFTIIDDRLAEALLSMVRNGEEADELRGKAAISLGPTLEYAATMGFEDADDILVSEEVFLEVQQSLRELFLDGDVPRDVRRRILEASVRAPQDWHRGAIRAAYSSGDETWKLTSVFCMQFVSGFDDQILEALASNDPEIEYQAVCAASAWEIDAAWPYIAALVTGEATDKPLLLAAIEAVASIRPEEASEILGDLTDSDDEEVVEVVFEALAMAEASTEDEDDDEESDEHS